MTAMKVLVFSDDPVAAAHMVVDMENAGPFISIPVAPHALEDAAGLPEGDVAILALGGSMACRDAVFAELRGRQMPVFVLAGFKCPETADKHFRSVTVPNPIDYDLLARQILDIRGVSASDAPCVSGARPLAASPESAAG